MTLFHDAAAAYLSPFAPVDGKGNIVAQRARARIAHADPRPLPDQIDDLRDRTLMALHFNGREATPRNVFLVMSRMQERRAFNGMQPDPDSVRHGTFAGFCPVPEGR